MKIKSINKTSQYKHIEFGEIEDCWQDSEIYTPNGFKKIMAFEMIKSSAPTKMLKLSNGMFLQCDPKHRLKTTNGTKFAEDLTENDQLIGYDGPVDFEICEGSKEDLYDIQINDPHWYYTSGVVSHNSIFLVNQALANVKRGRNVLFITLELSDLKTALRTIGALSKLKIRDRHSTDVKAKMMKIANTIKSSGAGDLVIYEFPPDEVSVNEIYALIDELRRTKGWIPDVVVVDYLELMASRRSDDNKDEYKRQKACSTQLRGLAHNENVLVFTATQTNRSGNEKDKMLDVGKIAESYGKAMPMDYLISINQTEDEYKERPARAHIYVAKNRNGSKFESIEVKIDYETMYVEELNL